MRNLNNYVRTTCAGLFPSLPRYVTRFVQGTPIDVPYLEGFPVVEEIPSIEWLSKVAAVVVRTLLGSVR